MYTTYSDHLKRLYGPGKVQKISVNAGTGCPNRDGTIGRGGCIYCANDSFTPAYCLNGPAGLRPGGVRAQLEEGIRFFARKYPQMRYIAYFQSYTSTFTSDIPRLRAMYEEALDTPGVIGLVIGTRPDCLPPQVLDVISAMARRVPVTVELGAETSHDRTLADINRGHTWQAVVDAAEAVVSTGAEAGLHLIAGLPGETEDDILETVGRAVTLPVTSLKFHQLQVIRGTELHRRWMAGQADIIEWTPERYIQLCARIIGMVPPHIAIERFVASAPPEMVVSPKWGIKNHVFVNMLNNFLRSR